MANFAKEDVDASKIKNTLPCIDGVFSNLNAKPEIIRIENLKLDDKPPVRKIESSNV